VTRERFVHYWRDHIEDDDLLALDSVHSGASSALAAWRGAGADLILATMRQRPDRLYNELERLELRALFTHVVVAETQGGWRAKAAKVGSILRNPSSAVWIGDTEIDLRCAEVLHCRPMLVTSGIRSATFLRDAGAETVMRNLVVVLESLQTEEAS
jgi:phosphoglycolate phosphatase-like HAD superfamily hydrolase